MPKNITFPTDAKLYIKSMNALRKLAIDYEIELRQSYKFLAKKAFRKINQYFHARKHKKARREQKRLKTYLGSLLRDIERKIKGNEYLMLVFEDLFEIIKKVMSQERDTKDKIYSIHEPHVECICKGKEHKKYEFGCKASIVITHNEGFVIYSGAKHGNPYDGHTLSDSVESAEEISKINIEQIYVDKGYKGHGIKNKKVFVSGQGKKVTRWYKKQIKRRQAIEPHIGHMKSDGKLDRNFLKGIIGDELNSALCGIGHNIRLIVNHLIKISRQKEKTEIAW